MQHRLSCAATRWKLHHRLECWWKYIASLPFLPLDPALALQVIKCLPTLRFLDLPFTSSCACRPSAQVAKHRQSAPVILSNKWMVGQASAAKTRSHFAFRISHFTWHQKHQTKPNHTIKQQLYGARKGCPLDRPPTPSKHVGRLRDLHHLGCRALVANLFARQPLGRQQLHLGCLHRGEERRGWRKGWRLGRAQPPLQARPAHPSMDLCERAGHHFCGKRKRRPWNSSPC